METVLRRELIVDRRICKIIGVGFFVMATALGAFVRIPLPFTPVPITMQTFFVLLSGAFLGSGLGLTSQAIYLVIGCLGLPIFSQGNFGFAYILGPTGGYILGFIMAAYFIGRSLDAGINKPWRVFLYFLTADLIILSCGSLWLSKVFNISLFKASLLGFLPFVPGNLIKISFATILYGKLKNRLEQIF